MLRIDRFAHSSFWHRVGCSAFSLLAFDFSGEYNRRT
jgi:hypothetical protein